MLASFLRARLRVDTNECFKPPHRTVELYQLGLGGSDVDFVPSVELGAEGELLPHDLRLAANLAEDGEIRRDEPL